MSGPCNCVDRQLSGACPLILMQIYDKLKAPTLQEVAKT